MTGSPTRYKTDYAILGVLGALTAGVLLLLVLWGWLETDRRAAPGIRTTHSTNVDGAIVCYTLYERLGITVDRSEKVLMSDVLDRADVLFQLDPTVRVNSEEIEDIRSWLISGGVLISTEVPRGLARDLRALRRGATRSGSSPRGTRRSDRTRSSQPSSIPAAHGGLPLARDVSRVYFETSDILSVDFPGPNDRHDGVETLLADECGVRIAAHKLGRGRLIVLADCSPLANGQIGKGDNSVLAVNLVAYALSKARGGHVVFDEYHLGFGHHQSGFHALGQSLFTTPAGWAVLSLTAAGVLYLMLKGRRFGSRRDLQRKQRRSKLEYIYGVGATYRAAGANRLALQFILVWLRHKTARLVGLTHDASNGVIAAALSRRTGADQRQYKGVLDRCDRLLARARLSQRHLLLAIKQLAQFEMEIFNGHRNRK